MSHMTNSLSGGVSGSGLRSVWGGGGETTGPGRPPSVVLWALVLLSWGPGPVLVLVLVQVLQDPSHLAHLD